MLPSLANWEQSSHSLHRASQLLGAIRQLVREPVANYLELALRVEPSGLSTDVLPTGGTVRLLFGQAALHYTPPSGAPVPIPLNGHSQASLLETLLRAMAEHGDAIVTSHRGEPLATAFLEALSARGHVFNPPPGDLTDTAPLRVDPAVGADYAHVLYRVFTAIARFRARLAGPQTPIVVWPEHWDLSTLWFATNDRSDSAPSMNWGFAPFDAATERPYVYAYAYPMPPGFELLPLPAPTRWTTATYKGLILPYDDLRATADPEATIEALCEAVFDLLSPTLGR